MTNELPAPWAEALAPKGIHSYRDMGAAANISHETARRLVTGGATSSATVNKVADSLFGGDRTQVWSLYGAALNDYGPWELPAEASLLNEDQREAVIAVIRAMVPSVATSTGGDGNADNTGRSTPTSKSRVNETEEEEAARHGRAMSLDRESGPKAGEVG